MTGCWGAQPLDFCDYGGNTSVYEACSYSSKSSEYSCVIFDFVWLSDKELPWEKLGAIDENKGYLIIKEKGTLSTWENVEVSTMLNLCVLLPLIRQIKYDNRINQSLDCDDFVIMKRLVVMAM